MVNLIVINAYLHIIIIKTFRIDMLSELLLVSASSDARSRLHIHLLTAMICAWEGRGGGVPVCPRPLAFFFRTERAVAAGCECVRPVAFLIM
jgi:hypothetical protein